MIKINEIENTLSQSKKKVADLSRYITVPLPAKNKEFSAM